MAQASKRSRVAQTAQPHLQRATLRTATIWPRRNQPGFSRELFQHSLSEANRMMRAPPKAPKKQGGIGGIFAAGVRFCQAVGIPELYQFDPNRPKREETKAPTLLEIEKTVTGLVIRVTHRVAHSRERLQAASDALADILEILGSRILFRDITHAPNMGGWRANLRIALSSAGGPATSLVR